MKKKAFRLFALSRLCTLSLAACEKPGESVNPSSNVSEKGNSEKPASDTQAQNIAVKEVFLTLSKERARVGDEVTAEVKFKPTNATNQEFTLSSSDVAVAKIENGKIICLAKGITTITARSKSNATKKAEAKLTVLGTDEEGRSENIFEAEDANLVKSDSSSRTTETVEDERLSGTGVVGSIKKGDRLIWGINASAEDKKASRTLRRMGPSGWFPYWDSLSFDFADFYTVKVNGKVIDTEKIHVEGTNKTLSSADYFAVQDILIGDIELKQGLNVITLVLSNRYDTTKYDNYTIGCFGNIDCLKIWSKADLTAVSGTNEAEGADPDVIRKETKIEVEDNNTRVYVDSNTPKRDLAGADHVEFKADRNIRNGVEFTEATKGKVTLRIAAPFKSATASVEELEAEKLLSIYINGVKVDLSSWKFAASQNAKKNNYVDRTTSLVDFSEGKNEINIVISDRLTGYEFLGALDYIKVSYFKGARTTFLNDEPSPMKELKLEAEAATTKLVNLDKPATGVGYVELKPQFQVQKEIYNNKTESPKVIYGIEAEEDCYVNITLRRSSPYIDATTAISDISVGNLGDLWVNGTIVSTPNVIKGTSSLGVKDNFSDLEIAETIKLHKGKNRIAWETRNYTDNTYTYYGGRDSITLTSTGTLKAYEVNFWADRNTYFDDDNHEPRNVTVDKVLDEANWSHYWVALYKEDDSVEENQPGSLYWYYPSSLEGGVGTFNLRDQNPNSERPLVSSATGGRYKIVLRSYDYPNDKGGYPVVDTLHIGIWDDVGNYGGRK